MASSEILTCIHSVWPDAEWWMNHKHDQIDVDFKNMRIALRTLKAFVVICARKLPDHAGLGSFLVRINVLIREKAEELHACRVDDVELEADISNHGEDIPELEVGDSDLGEDSQESEVGDSDLGEDSQESEVSYDLDEILKKPVYRAIHVADWLREFMIGSVDEINKWYVAVLECSPRSSSLTANEVLEIISDVIENIADDRLMKLREKHMGAEVLESQCGEQVLFLKSLIQFVNQASFDGCENLLAHAEGIAIKFASLLFQDKYDDGRSVSSEISMLLRKIRPFEPRVCEIYAGALTRSKLSERLPDSAAMKNFLDSLISNLWEVLRMDTVSKKDQLKRLYEGFRSLRTAIFIKQAAASFEKQIQKNIAHLICDAGIYLCSLYQAHADNDRGMQPLLGMIKTILEEVGYEDLHMLKLNHPKPSSYAYVDFILEKLMGLKIHEPESAAKSHAGTIQEELASVRCLLGKVADLRDEKVEIQTLWDRLLVVAYKVEDEIDHQDYSFSTSFDSIMKCIGNIKADALKIDVKYLRRRSISHVASKSPSMSMEVVGFGKEEKKIIDRLRRESKRLEIIPIVGMPGLGKTTLATKVFNDPSISRHFPTSAWCSISQALDKRKVLLDLFKQVWLKPVDVSEMSEDDLANKLRQSLKRKRYLIYLDDIWNTEAWYSLKGSFPDDDMKSRIILTSRSHDMPDKEPVTLSALSNEESMELLRRRLFPGEGNAWPVELHDLGMQMAERCKGLPLSIVVLAGVLENVELEDWQKILDGFSFVSVADSCKHTLELSHKHLPDHIKPCLVYFGAFPEDEEIQVKRLLRLWIAEGFVRKSETKSLEDVAEDYLTTLIGRSLIMAAKRRSDGGVKTCRIHDLLRDFCLQQSKDEHFFHSVKGHELLSFNEPHNLRMLWIESEPEHIKGSKLICSSARSLHFSPSHQSRSLYRGLSGMLHFCQLLRVLDLGQIDIPKFPSGIRQLVLLAFLSINVSYFDNIPSWIDDLSRLETLIIIHEGNLQMSFPDSLWNLQKLKYLYTSTTHSRGGSLPRRNLENSSVLCELDRISGADIHWGSMEKQLRKFPNVRNLKCGLDLDVWDTHTKYPHKFVFPSFLSRLEALTMSAGDRMLFTVGLDFASLTSLKKLKLSCFQFRWEIFSAIGAQLPDLEVLKLHDLEFIDGVEYTWEMKQGEFAKLRILHLSLMPLRGWTTSEDHEFECFQKLVLNECYEIRELPSCLESIETLEMIEIRFCNEDVKSLAVNIKESQHEDWGNSAMKIEI